MWEKNKKVGLKALIGDEIALLRLTVAKALAHVCCQPLRGAVTDVLFCYICLEIHCSKSQQLHVLDGNMLSFQQH